MSDHEFTDAVYREIARLIVGKQIGLGAFRRVIKYLDNDDLVIKVEEDARCFYNAKEWAVWQEVEGTPFARWFAPCVEISPWCTALVQKRTKPVPAKFMPKMIPSCLKHDVKLENWGLYDGRVVCHDYGHMKLMGSRKLVKVKWQD
jgi:hypothetical protein